MYDATTDEPLGEISWKYYRGDYRYFLENKRAERELLYNKGRYTADIDVAVKHLKKYFKPKSNTERVFEDVSELRHLSNQASWDFYHKVSNAEKEWREALEPHIVDNYRRLCADFDIELELDWDTAKAEHEAAEQLTKAIDNKQGYFVRRIKDQYYWSDDGANVQGPCTLESMPTDARTNMGMLALIESKETAIPEVGVKKGNYYFVLRDT